MLKKRTLSSLKNKAFRSAYFRQHIHSGLAHQIRLMREDRGWTQKELAQKIGLRSQSAVARLEDPSYGRVSVATIIKLAEAFDVAAFVRLVSYRKLLDETADLSLQALIAPPFESDLAQEVTSKLLHKVEQSSKSTVELGRGAIELPALMLRDYVPLQSISEVTR